MMHELDTMAIATWERLTGETHRSPLALVAILNKYTVMTRRGDHMTAEQDMQFRWLQSYILDRVILDSFDQS